MRGSFIRLAVYVACCVSTTVRGQTVEKVADLSFSAPDGVGVGGYYPLDRLTQQGTNLWFTTERGGTFDAGTVSRFDLVTRQVVQAASLDNNTGKNPDGAILVIGNEGYFTTKNGGVGNEGTIARIDLASGIVTPVYSFPTNANKFAGSTPRGGLSRIGHELWTTTSSGGASNRGTIVRFNLTNSVTTLVTNFDGPVLGGQPYESFTSVGDAHYFTTFTGGSTFGTTGLTLGAGTLSRLTFNGAGDAIIDRLVDLPGGYTQFPANRPELAGTNALYFTTVGPNTSPGAIIRYDIDSGTWTNLFSFNTNVFNPVLVGKQPGYNGLVHWQNELYFLTRQGGISNRGVIAKFNLASNSVVKLADLTGVGADSFGDAATGFNTGTIVEETNRFFLYFPVARGGKNSASGITSGMGTIIRVALPAPSILLSLHRDEQDATLSWVGGYSPFTVQARADFASGSWTNLVEGVTNRSLTLSNLTGAAFFRVVGE